MFKRVKRHEIEEKDGYRWIDPFKLKMVIEVKYERLNPTLNDTYRFEKGKWEKEDEDKFITTLSKPVFVRIRDDKSINKSDLRLTQIPNFDELKKEFKKKAQVIISARDYMLLLKRPNSNL